MTGEVDTWKYFRIIECFVDHCSFKESGEMRSKLCAGICLTGDPSILLRVQVEKVVVGGRGSLWRREGWH